MMATLAQITMNAGYDIPGSTIRQNIKDNSALFERVVIVDGNLTDKAKEFYKRFDNVEVIDSPWNDDYAKQYKAWFNVLKEGEWVLYLDCDEHPSKELIYYLHSDEFEEHQQKYRLIKLPCVLHLTEDYKSYYPVEKNPEKEYKGQWTKNILLKKCDDIDFQAFGSHVVPFVSNKLGADWYVPHSYFHMKSLNSFAYNDVFQAFLHPEGQQYTAVEAAKFKLLTKQYKTTKEFKEATRKGKWSPALEKFALDHMKVYDRPISRLAYVYLYLEQYKKCTPNLELIKKYPLEVRQELKKHILSGETMELFEENKKQGNSIIIEDTTKDKI